MQLTETISKELATQHYAFLDAEDLPKDLDLLEDKEAFFRAWDNLEDDKYLPNGASYRQRRFDTVRFYPITGKIELLPHQSFVQSEDYNSVAGGVQREFAPLESFVLSNYFFKALLQFDFEIILANVAPDLREKPWDVHVHFMRVIASQGQTGNPTPEGIHQDDVDFIAMHLIQRSNVKGGNSLVYTTEKEQIDKHTLTNPLDSMFINDRALMHAASPTQPINPNEIGIRDLLTFDCTCVK